MQCIKKYMFKNCNMTHSMLVLSLLYSLFITGFCSEEDGKRSFFFTAEPQSKLIFSNNRLSEASCSVKGSRPITISWINGSNNKVHSDGTLVSVRTSNDRSLLRFLPFHPAQYRQSLHFNTYRCLASNKYGSILSRPISVQAVVSQDYNIITNNVNSLEGETVMVSCNVPHSMSNYVNITSWNVDGRELEPTLHPDGRYWMLPSKELLILGLRTTDSISRINCITHDPLHQEMKASNPSTINIKDNPQSTYPTIIHGKEWVTIREGDSTVLPCITEGNPRPDIRWYKESGMGGRIPIPSEANIEIIENQLVLIKVRNIHDGVYLCEANNSYGTDVHRTTVEVRSLLSVTVRPRHSEVDIRSSVTLSCEVRGYPVTSISWYKNSKLLTYGPRLSMFSRSLHINQVYPEDKGLYQCFAKNSEETAQGTAEISISESKPVLEYKFISQIMQPGPSVTLKCIASGSPPPVFEWTLDGFPLPKDNRITFGQYSYGGNSVVSHVNITTVQSQDGGGFRCTARNIKGEASHMAMLNVYGPAYVRPMPPITAIDGKDLWITCPASGYPLKHVKWTKNGKILPSSNRQNFYDNGTLHIQNVQKKIDGGLYSCSAADKRHHVHSSSVDISVLVPPKINSFSFRDDLTLGDRVSVQCSVHRGDSPLKVTWQKNGLDSSQLDDVEIKQYDEFTSLLVIHQLSRHHAGNYQCNAKNPAGSQNHNATLRVNAPPIWKERPKNISIIAGQDISIPCSASGYPEPQVIWKYNDTKTERTFGLVDNSYNSRINAIEVSANGSFLIRTAKSSDSGSYICQISNGIGMGLTEVIHLTVKVPPKISEHQKRNFVLQKGSKLSLQCDVRGDHPLQIEWIKSSDYSKLRKARVKKTQTGVTSEFSLTSTSVEDGGTYICTASNDYGKDTKKYHVTIEDVPHPPYGLRVDEYHSRSLQISWLPPIQRPQNPIIKYYLQYKHDNGNDWNSNEVSKIEIRNSTTAYIKGLYPSIQYLIRIIAVNQIGESKPSEALQAQTQAEAPSTFPPELTVEALSSRELHVKWKPINDGSHPSQTLGFSIGFKKTDENGSYEFVSLESDTYTHLLERLLPWTSYSIVIRAYNSAGYGPNSPPVVTKTKQDLPDSAPTNLRCEGPSSSKSLYLKWEAPPQSSFNGIFTGYRVSLSPLLEEKSSTIMKMSFHSYIVAEELLPWTNYSISVSACSEAGVGVSSKEIICRTGQDVPSAPGGLRALQSAKNSVFLTWLEPSQKNGVLDGYKLYHQSPSRQKISEHIIPAEQAQLTLNNLIRGMHTFWLKARSHVGEGRPTSSVDVQLRQKVSPAIASWGRFIVSHQGRTIVLNCQVVGSPVPKIAWLKRDELILGSTKFHLNDDGSLIINSVTKEDVGNYTCKIIGMRGMNGYHQGPTKITYSLSVLVPPSVPILRTVDATESTISISWKVEDTGGTSLTSCSVWWRKKNPSATWSSASVSRNKDVFQIVNLDCGTEYQIYAICRSNVGSSPASESVFARTKGQKPLAPRPEQMVSHNETNIRIWLNKWSNEECGITHFTLEIRQHSENVWTTLASNLAPREAYDLPKNKETQDFGLRLTAYNSAGATTSTVLVGKGKVASTIDTMRKIESDVTLLSDPRLLASCVASLFAVLLTIGSIVLCIRKRSSDWQSNQTFLSGETDDDKSKSTRMTMQKDAFRTLIQHHPSSLGLNSIPECAEDICPYATYQRSDSYDYHNGSCYSGKMKTFFYKDALYGTSQSQASTLSVDEITSGRKISDSEEFDSDSEDAHMNKLPRPIPGHTKPNPLQRQHKFLDRRKGNYRKPSSEK